MLHFLLCAEKVLMSILLNGNRPTDFKSRVTEYHLWVYTVTTNNVMNVYVHLQGYLRACQYNFTLSSIKIPMNCRLQSCPIVFNIISTFPKSTHHSISKNVERLSTFPITLLYSFAHAHKLLQVAFQKEVFDRCITWKLVYVWMCYIRYVINMCRYVDHCILWIS
jgi:hypothetical protein